MRALVTGSYGFIGKHVSLELYNRGYQVFGVDPMAREGQRGVFKNHFIGLREFLDNRAFGQYDLVVHCAYEVGGRAHIDGSNLALAHNLEMDALLFDWAVRTEQKAVLYFSSCAAYSPCYQGSCPRCVDGPQRMSEDDLDIDNCHPHVYPPADNYGWAKLTGERLGRAAADLGLRVHTVRPFSGYGPGQSLDYPFPAIVSRARRGDLSVWGPPGQHRDWIHVSDVVRAALAVYESDYRQPINLCSGVGTEMGELARKVYRQHACNEGWAFDIRDGKPDVVYLEDKPTGPLYRVGDPTRMNQFYVPKVSLEEGIEEALRG